MKHMLTDARDCTINWEIDYGKIELLIKVEFLSPALILDFLATLHHREEALQKIGIAGAMQVTRRFVTALECAGTKYRLRVYESTEGATQIELFPLGAA